MRIIGIDPGYAIVGCGIVDYVNTKFKPVFWAPITTPAGMPFDDRLEIIFNDLTQIIDKYKPDALSVEELFFTSNQKTVISVAQARGVILIAAKKKNVPVFEYTPLQVKQSVVGYGRAEKKQVMEMTRIILGLEKVPKPDDVADALAMAICHAHCSGSLIKNLSYR